MSKALAAPVAVLLAIVLGTGCAAVWRLNNTFPLSSITSVPMPDLHVGWRGDCLQSGALIKSLYISQLEPGRLLDWLKSQGWMANYRYGDSVLQQHLGQAGPIAWSTVREIFVEARSGGSRYVDTRLFLVSIGSC